MFKKYSYPFYIATYNMKWVGNNLAVFYDLDFRLYCQLDSSQTQTKYNLDAINKLTYSYILLSDPF